MIEWNTENDYSNAIYHACGMLHSMGLHDTHLSKNNESDPVIAFTHNDISIFNPYVTSNGFEKCEPSVYGLNEIQANALCKINDALGFNWEL